MVYFRMPCNGPNEGTMLEIHTGSTATLKFVRHHKSSTCSNATLGSSHDSVHSHKHGQSQIEQQRPHHLPLHRRTRPNLEMHSYLSEGAYVQLDITAAQALLGMPTQRHLVPHTCMATSAVPKDSITISIIFYVSVCILPFHNFNASFITFLLS